MFYGESEHNLDDKGRIFLPARFREELGENVVVMRGTDGQLSVYPLATWEKVAANIGSQNQALQAARDMARLAYAANPIQVDKQGRIVISPVLRRRAQLESAVVIVGVRDRVEIWSPERWEAYNDRVAAEGSEIAEKMAALGLVL